MKVVGLTGGIATGKSTVSETIQKNGIDVVDCDKIAHAVVKKGRWGYNRVVNAFGKEILREDGELDRSALGNIIFNDSDARKKLNKATHVPVFVEMFWQLFWHWMRCRSLVVVDMPLLFETGSDKWFGTSVLVACSESMQIKRLILRDNCPQESAEAKVAAQMPLQEKRKRAAYVIENEGSREDTAAEARRLMKILRKKAFITSIFTSPVAISAAFAAAWAMMSGPTKS